MKPFIYLDAGHSIYDPGAISPDKLEIESVHARAIRDLMVPILQKNGFTVLVVPDNLDLTETVRWINERARNLEDGFAFALHLNSNSGTTGIGAEGWFCAGSPDSPAVQMAQNAIKTIVDLYSERLGFHNRGVFPDSKARFERLGFVRDTNCFAGIIELCFINNHEEITRLKNNYQLIAETLSEGIAKVYGKKETLMQIENESQLDELYWMILLRHLDTAKDDYKGYLGQSDVFVTQELLKSPERKQKEEREETLQKIKELIG